MNGHAHVRLLDGRGERGPAAPGAAPRPAGEAAERLRLARELHDWVGSGVCLALRQLDLHSIDAAQGREPHSPHLDQARSTLVELLTTTRSLVADLRDGTRVADLRDGLRQFAELTGEPGIEVAVHGDQSLLPAPVREEVFLIVREAMRNALAHSGGDTVSATVRIDRARLVAVVADDGVGPGGLPAQGGPVDEGPRRPAGTGMASMHERAWAVGGRLRVSRRTPRGTRVELVVDLPAEQAHAG